MEAQWQSSLAGSVVGQRGTERPQFAGPIGTSVDRVWGPGEAWMLEKRSESVVKARRCLSRKTSTDLWLYGILF